MVVGLYVKENSGVWFGVACGEAKVYGLTFNSSRENALRTLRMDVPLNMPFQQAERLSPFAESIVKVLEDMYAGREASWRFPLATEHLTEYTRKVIQATRAIPLGYVSSYGAVAAAAGGSARAVGNVMARHPFPLVVPCHRVVTSDFGLGGFGGGLDVKVELLKRESRGYKAERVVNVDGGGRLAVFPAEFVLSRLGKSK